MQRWLCVTKFINVIYYINRLKQKSHRIFFIDLEKVDEIGNKFRIKPEVIINNKGSLNITLNWEK